MEKEESNLHGLKNMDHGFNEDFDALVKRIENWLNGN
jgi:hypothetical protein